MASNKSKFEPQTLGLRPTADGIEIDLHIDTDLAPFAGHFPGLPIVPGVCLLDWVTRFAGRHLFVLRNGAKQFQIKFRRVLEPGHDVTLTMRILPGDRLQFDYWHLETVYASGTAWGGGA